MRNKKQMLATALYGSLSPLKWLSPRHSYQFPAILTYHRIYDLPPDYRMTKNVINCGPELFEKQIIFLKKNFNIINFRDLQKAEDQGQVPPANSLIITFDDGYFDNHHYALPILQKHKATATVFLSTGFLDEAKPYWVDKLAYQIFTTKEQTLELNNGTHKFLVKNGQRNNTRVAIGGLCSSVSPGEHMDILKEVDEQTGIHSLPDEHFKHCRPMTWDEARELDAAGIELGAHSVNHHFLDQLDDKELDYELGVSKSRIEEEINNDVISMAFPSGAYNQRVINSVEKHQYKYSCAFNNYFDADASKANKFALSRIVVDKNMPTNLFKAQLFFPGLFLKTR